MKVLMGKIPHTKITRALLSILLCAPLRLFAVGFTPTSGGLVVNLKPEDKILISVMVDHDNNDATPDREYFVGNYSRYTGDDYFKYDGGQYLKLFTQPAAATQPADMIVWTVDSALSRLDVNNVVGGGKDKDYSLGGISYTLWNDGKTFRTNDKDIFKFFGDLEGDIRKKTTTDVVFVIPTDYASNTSFDPNNTMKRGTLFNGQTGTGFMGMTYREVYMMVIPRFNVPVSYTNAAVVTFNTTNKVMKLSSGAGDIASGHAAYAYADNKHKPTPRTIFRLYILNEPIHSCGGYFFAYDEQNTLKYREGPNNNPKKDWTDSTALQKVFTMDRLFCIDQVGSTTEYRTGGLRIPAPDSTYFYVGRNNHYYNNDGEGEEYRLNPDNASVVSLFTKIRELPLKNLPTMKAPAGAYGQMVVNTGSTDNNLGVQFEPTGYFLKVSTGKNVPLVKIHDNEWVTQDVWTINEGWDTLKIKATLMTGPEFREDDPGADLEGWSVAIRGYEVPVDTGGTVTGGMTGYTVIYTNNASPNGNMTFIPANTTRYVHYDNNGFIGAAIPDQYPMGEVNTIMVERPRLNTGYTFDGWNTKADGSGDTIQPGTILTLSEGDTVLYALAHYDGEYNIAISFIHPTDGNRYFLQHPGAAAPRYARARTFSEWTNVWQGMENAENLSPDYINTFTIRKNPPSGDPEPGEKVLDPMHHTVRGYEDSLIFYEHFTPGFDEYLGLYYQEPNTILANNSWSGLFIAEKDSKFAWPDIKTPAVDGVTLKSTHYLEAGTLGDESSLVRKERDASVIGKPYVKYNERDNQFDGDIESNATSFQLSAVVVADAHYVVLPDTTVPWADTITFEWHQNEALSAVVESRLIGKQLLAAMTLIEGERRDTIFFHPNRDKIFTTPQELYLSSDFRLSQTIEFIRDSRVSTPFQEGDSVMMEETEDYWVNNLVSGNTSPLNVKDGSGNYIDIEDTVRIRLSQGGISRIKDYYGRWNKKASGLKMDKDGSRYRDIIIRTKTYHQGNPETRLILQPELETYSFSPLTGNKKQINFLLIRETSRSLFDKDNNAVSTEVISRDTITSQLALGPGMCSLKGSNFSKVDAETTSDHVTLITTAENTEGVNYDTLTVTIETITVSGKTYTNVSATVPLMQAALTSNELLWSVVDGEKRYFILAKSGGLEFRQYRLNNSILYKENTSTHLKLGSKDAANSDKGYITPWIYTYAPADKTQLTLKAILTASDTAHLKVDGAPTCRATDSTLLTYEIVTSYTNANANYEEQVKLRFGSNQWLKFTGGATPSLSLTTESTQATTFSWSYLVQEYSLLNNGTYPNRDYAEFGYNEATSVSIQTRYKAYKEFSTLLDNTVTYLCRQEETNVGNLRDAEGEWKTDILLNLIRDSRFGIAKDSSKLDTTINRTTLTTTVAPRKPTMSPLGTMYGGEYVNIVDTLDVRLVLKPGAPAYRFKDKWSSFTSVEDAHLKIPLIRKTYHLEAYDSLHAVVDDDQYSYTFPAAIVKGTNDSCVFSISTINRTGMHMLDVEGHPVRSSGTTEDVSDEMNLNDKNLAEVRLADEYGNIPDWCTIRRKNKQTIVIECTKNGIRSPRNAYIYLAYIVMVDHDKDPETDKQMRFVNFRLSVSQASSFTYTNNQVLHHSAGASGDEPMANGMQQVHENRRILYYYPDQDVELPLRERAFYGWWRWYREGKDVNGVDVSDSDIPDSLWRVPPTNQGKYNFPFRIIGDSVMLKKKDGTDSVKIFVTMGRYTVFHYRSRDYGNKNDPPAKNPRVAPPTTEFGGKRDTLIYAVDISNYYDNLPMSVTHKNQVDTALLDTIIDIHEPTLSLREIFELHPWTEMAARLDGYKSIRTDKDAGEYVLASEKYMEDHVVMAPIGNRLLLQTEQRYNLDNLALKGYSESLLGYYMRDDNWSSWEGNPVRQDTMIWCGGWDADCLWYTYDQKTKKYSKCNYSITEDDDFLQVPAKSSITTGNEFDTVYYCLRARSWSSPVTPPAPGTVEEPDSGAYMFNICRYMIIYHNPNQYGPKIENQTANGAVALISNAEIEQRYEVLERLNFDYIQPGTSYHVYPHPLPWADASYGYTYPETANLPHNRYHAESDFPNHGEYGLVNRIPYASYWHKMEQHGGAANGYMIYCDGMASSGQVAALSLETNLCAGQKMFFSGYVGNPSNQTGKSNPNFIFSVQGSLDGVEWDDITSYMTGDILPSDKWYQIYFPIIHTKNAKEEYSHFRVRIYNVANSFDGNDFIIDDMCIFATKPPLIAYQANTTCKKYGESTGDTHVLLRLDYQGITGEGYHGKEVFYTIEMMTPDSVRSFVSMSDGYLQEDTAKAIEPATLDTLYGKIFIPLLNYEPQDSIFRNMNALLDTFDATFTRHKADPSIPIFREGYIYEILEGSVRPVKYIVHSAPMDPKNDYTVHMSGELWELMSSMCAMTSHLKISNRMVLELNGEEKPEVEVLGLCANSTYDISLKVKGSMYLDSVAPIDVEGSCVNDWLLYGDTVRESSIKRYGYSYNDIVKVVKDILRCDPMNDENANQFAPNLTSISRTEMQRIKDREGVDLETSDHPYDVVAHLVNNGFLKLYKSRMTVTVTTGDSVEYTILPIIGTGSKTVVEANVEVCPNPIHVKLMPVDESGLPLIIGGLHRDSTQLADPVEVLLSASTVNSSFKLRVDSIMASVGVYSVELRSTDDPDFITGVHTLRLLPDRPYPSEGYYVKGDSILLRPAPGTNYIMKAGYHYTFNIVMQTIFGQLHLPNGCEVGVVPITLSIVPDYMRWEPRSPENNNWNEAENWIGINEHNEVIDPDAHFVPMEHTSVLIPKMTDGLPYPVLPALPLPYADSVQKVNFQYNTCNAIRFLPEAAMAQQHRMSYTDVVADMSTPYNQWAFRSSPVKGMISGDLFRADADINGETPLWEVGEFDASGRNTTTGNTSFWLSLYSRTTIRKGNGEDTEDTIRNATADWSKVTNGLSLPLPAGMGWAVYSRTKVEDEPAVVRLPKHDDKYYYYTRSGDKVYDLYEQNLQALRTTVAGGERAGELAFYADYEEYTLVNDKTEGGTDVETTSFVFGNPTMGYIDIWGFIADNCLKEEIDYMAPGNSYTTVTKATAEALGSPDEITNQRRYLPPMHAMVIKLRSEEAAVNEKTLVLNSYRVITEVSQKLPAIYACGSGGDQATAQAPRRADGTPLSQGIMTVTALNPVSPRCNSRLLLGQGYHDAIREGEDAVLTTVNIDNFSMTATPTTPFNIYAVEGANGLSIDLRDSIVNVPVSFYLSDLEYEPVTELWFTGVNHIEGELVLYDALYDTERAIIDGICLTIETPEANHQTRYYIRRPGFRPNGSSEGDGVTTGTGLSNTNAEPTMKLVHRGQVLILRGGHVYTMMGQKVR